MCSPLNALVTRSLLVSLAVLASLISVSDATGQGTMNQVADPMTTKQFTQLMNRHVVPTFEQWELIEGAQDAYLESYQKLRDGPIAKFLDEAAMLRSGLMPTRSQVEQYLRDAARVEKLVRSVDEALFSSVQTLLREDQHAGLQRVVLKRERLRLSSGLVSSSMGAGLAFDLWETVDASGIEGEQLARIDGLLIDYEKTLTRFMSDLHRESGKSMLFIIEEIEAAGLADVDMMETGMNDPELMNEMMQVMQTAYIKSMVKPQEIDQKVRGLNHRTLLKLCAALDSRNARLLKMNFDPRMGMVSILSGGSASSGEAELVRCLDRVLARESLSLEVREQLSSITERYINDHHKLLDKRIMAFKDFDAVDLMTEAMAIGSSDGVGESLATQNAAKLRENEQAQLKIRSQASKDAMNAISGLEGHERRICKEILTGSDSAEIQTAFSDASESIASAEAWFSSDADVNSDYWIAKPIDALALARLRRLLGVEEWQKPVLEALHEEYLATWQEKVASLERESGITGSRRGELGTDQQEFNSRVEKSFNLLCAAIESSKEIDRAFFEDIKLAVPEESAPLVEALVLERVHRSALAGQLMDFSPYASARPVSPISTLLDLDLESAERDALAGYIVANASSMIESQRNCFQKQLSFKKEGELNEFHLYNSGRDMDMTYVMESQSIIARQVNQIRLLQKDASAEETAFTSGLDGILSAERIARFQSDHRVACNPEIYRDPSDIRPTFQSIFVMPDLGEEQLVRIGSLEEDFAARWEELSATMVEETRGLGQSNVWDGDDLDQQRMVNSMARFERATFERTELADRTLRRIARLLTSDQRSRVPALRSIVQQMNASAELVPGE